jgi:hypothetical protein
MMGFFGPDYGKIGRNYTKAVNEATDRYVSNVTPHADVGAGLNANTQQRATAANPGFQTDVLGSVGDYLDPSIQQGMNAVSAQYGGKGSLFSGAAAKGLMAAGQNAWGQAFDRAMADNNRINQLGQLNFSNQMSIDQFNNAASQTNFGNQFGINQQNFSNYNDVYGTQLGSRVNAANTEAQLKASERSVWDTLMDVGKLGVGGALAYGALK